LETGVSQSFIVLLKETQSLCLDIQLKYDEISAESRKIKMSTEVVEELVGFDRENEFDKAAISMAPPDAIRSWSKGEVKNPETINNHTFNPERNVSLQKV
jgi:hypothetical protein